jgi:hypothetical protein
MGAKVGVKALGGIRDLATAKDTLYHHLSVPKLLDPPRDGWSFIEEQKILPPTLSMFPKIQQVLREREFRYT